MIQKEKVQHLFYIDSETETEALLKEMLKRVQNEWYIFLQAQKERVSMKEANEFFTIESNLKIKDSDLDRLNYFFRGAVVPYYFRQSRHYWKDKIPSKELKETTDEMKRRVGFTLYDHTGKKTDNVNSITTFQKKIDFLEFLNDIQRVCFEDDDYIFPDSEHYNNLVAEKGRYVADRQVLKELFEKTCNKYQDRIIPEI